MSEQETKRGKGHGFYSDKPCRIVTDKGLKCGGTKYYKRSNKCMSCCNRKKRSAKIPMHRMDIEETIWIYKFSFYHRYWREQHERARGNIRRAGKSTNKDNE